MPVTKKSVVISWITYELAFEKGHIKYGTIVIDELKNVNLQGQRVIEFSLSTVQLQLSQPQGYVSINLVDNKNAD